jgi:DNA (cytosine-5)-methyltransferase 1|tara:strand:- start:747 stop:2546 length:1800 start_codon:yes stop_codon:yes gene_type:complete
MNVQELIIDSFAGGGGASTGIEMALGRSPDYAINHDPEALALHAANHPDTVHLSKNIYKVDPIDVVGNRAVGLLWASPDCKHFSKAKGGKPVKRTIRDLAWTVVLWAQRARPRVIILENVEEFKDWGPLVEKEPGKFTPCPERKGQEFTRWVHALKRNGYKVQWRELRACDYGAPTTRKRLFVIARRDGKKIVWPVPTHGAPTDPDVIAGKKLPWVTAAEIIDWSIPCPSIFDTSEEIMAKHGVRAVRPLADNTMARIAKGIKRYVLDAAKPFLVSVNHGYSGGRREYPTDEPMRAVTSGGISEAVIAPHVMTMRNAQKPHTAATEPTHTVTAGGAGLSLVAAHLSAAQHGGSHRGANEPVHTLTASPKDQNQVIAASMVQTGYGERSGQEPRALDPNKPLGTVVAGGAKHAAVAAFLAQHNTDVVGHDAREPVSTIVQKGSTQAVVSAGLMNMKGSDRRMSDIEQPSPTICADGNHVSEVRAFLMKYYGNEQDGHEPGNPLGAVTTRDRFGLVTVEGEQYQITDIGMRMLTPRELFKAQGFPPHYQIENGDFDGEIRPLTKTAQVRMCGNSVCPPIASALVSANCADMAALTSEAEVA